MRRLLFLFFVLLLAASCNTDSNKTSNQELKLNDLDYFETQGVNVLVYSNLFRRLYDGRFRYELIHQWVRTAGRCCKTFSSEQWDLSRQYQPDSDSVSNTIESVLGMKI